MRTRPEFGPSLATLVRGRFGVRERITIVLIVAVVATVPILLAVRRANVGGTPVVHRGTPTFALAYEPDWLRRAAPQDGEAIRFEARRNGMRMTVTARPWDVRLPSFAALPIEGSRHIERLRQQLAGFRLLDEGKARIDESLGYQVGFVFREGGRRVVARDLMLFPSDTATSGGVLLTFRQAKRGRGPLTEPQKDVIKQTRKALRSFAFGTKPL